MTKSYQLFDGKIRTINQHLQLLDIALSIANKNCLRNASENKTIAQALNSTVEYHPHLNHPAKATDIKRTFSTSRTRVNEQAFIELYAAFADYTTSLIKEIARGGSKEKILGLYDSNSNSSIKYHEILELGSYENIVDRIAKNIFRRLENLRSTTQQINKFLDNFNFDILPEIKEDAILFLEVRHLIIHNNSKADDDFLKKNSKGLIRTDKSGKIIINYKLSDAAIRKVTELCKSIDDEIVNKGLITNTI